MVAAVLALVCVPLCPGQSEAASYTISSDTLGAVLTADGSFHQGTGARGVPYQDDARTLAGPDSDHEIERPATPPQHDHRSCGPDDVNLLGVQPASAPAPNSVSTSKAEVAAWSTQPRPTAAIVGEICVLAGAELLVQVGVSRR
ncbi:hypothetical protein [Parafrankia sp. BMG5.11]|nr:hypothetical protein [Parafrankia sp. BMG5.11]TCJ31446.1 hypothetical protein E0504_48335 [Parafrankia sp. BMG5.11]